MRSVYGKKKSGNHWKWSWDSAEATAVAKTGTHIGIAVGDSVGTIAGTVPCAIVGGIVGGYFFWVTKDKERTIMGEECEYNNIDELRDDVYSDWYGTDDPDELDSMIEDNGLPGDND